MGDHGHVLLGHAGHLFHAAGHHGHGAFLFGGGFADVVHHLHGVRHLRVDFVQGVLGLLHQADAVFHLFGAGAHASDGFASFLLHGFNGGADFGGGAAFDEDLDRPGQLLGQHALPGRHVGDAEDDLALAHGLRKIGVVIGLAARLERRVGDAPAAAVEIAQIGRRGGVGAGIAPVAAGAGLIVGFATDGHGLGGGGLMTVGVGGQPTGAEGRQAASLHVGGNGDLLRSQRLHSQGEEQGSEQ